MDAAVAGPHVRFGSGKTGARAPKKPAAPLGVVSIGTHYLRYSTANALVLLAGLISFPALTRLLDNTQYGILGYYETWVMMAVAFAKLGAQHAIIRFYPHGGDRARMERFATNLFLLPMIASLCLWVPAVAAFAGFSWLGGVTYSPVLWLAILAIPLTVFASLAQMVIRAGELSGILMVTRIAWRWLELVAMLAAVIAIERSAVAAYSGKILAGLIIVVYYVRWVRQNLDFSRSAIDFDEFRDALRYGLPLVINEIAAVALVSIDRVMLKSMLGDFAAVGIYTIGYSLAIQVSIFMSASLSESFVPVANRVFESGGAAEVRSLKTKILLPMTYASIGIGIAIWSVGSEVLQAVSGPDKAASGPVFAWIGTLYAIYPLIDIGGYGLLLHKRPITVLKLTIAAVVVNVGLNLLLIPVYGLMGAVYSTAVAYLVLALGVCLLCPRDLLRLPDARSLLTACGAAALFLVALRATDLFGLSSTWPRLFAAGGLWVVTFVLPVLVIDGRLRHIVGQWKALRALRR